jgi:UDP-3-O-[3-hydroxymyristoyl] glucosamine N-acyltransferase
MRERTRIGDRCIIHNGRCRQRRFRYVQESRARRSPARHRLTGDVELGANVTVDRAASPDAHRNGVKVDNLVQIAHNVLHRRSQRGHRPGGISGSSSSIGELHHRRPVGIAGT